MPIKKGAIHIGGHFGEERSWYRNNGFKPVIWIEPDPNSYQILLENIKDFPEQSAYNVGIYHKAGKLPLHISSNESMSSSILNFKHHTDFFPEITMVNDIMVDLVRMDEFVKTNNININDYNLLNVDVQGVELHVLRSFGDLLKGFDYIFVEVNEIETYEHCTFMIDLDMYLNNYNFTRTHTEMQFTKSGDAVYTKKHV